MIREIFDAMERPKAEAPLWPKGTRVRQNGKLSGVVVNDTLAKLINARYGYGPLVIVAGDGMSYSYLNPQRANLNGWFLDWRPR